jgi:hypothetical protein
MDKLISTTKSFFAVLLFLAGCFSVQYTYAQERESPWSIGMNYSMMNNTLQSSIPEYRGIGIQIERKLINRFSVGSELNWYSQHDYTRTEFNYSAEFQ